MDRSGRWQGSGFPAMQRKGKVMRKSIAIVIACCAFALAMGLVGCGGSSSGSAASSSAASGSAASDSAASGSSGSESAASSEASSSAAQLTDIPADYLDIDGGITINAVRGLTGPGLVTLLKQQGYEWTGSRWENPATGDSVKISDVKDRTVKEDGYASALGKGKLAEGYIQIFTDARSIVTTPDDLEAVRDAMVPGATVEDSWLVGGGAYLYSAMTDDTGERFIIVVIANTDHEAIVEYETDAYLQEKGDGGVDGVAAVWNS